MDLRCAAIHGHREMAQLLVENSIPALRGACFLEECNDNEPTSEKISYFGIAVVLMCIICEVLQAGQVCLYFMTLPPFSPFAKD